MKVLLIGSGGREHALFWKLSQSPQLTELKVLPGNGGFPAESRVHDVEWRDFAALRRYVSEQHFDLVVVGPEDPLVAGITDQLQDICPVFGPDQGAARLEGSKDYSKEFMRKYNIPSADWQTFTDFDQAWAYLQSLPAPYVIKTDGLAAGKGVAVAPDLESAEKALRERMLDGKFGAAGQRVIIEEFMPGEEASVFALCDGQRALPFMASQDHKRAFDNDEGPNTGGMGAYLPVPFMTPALMQKVQTEVLDRALAGMQAEGHPYRGLLYAGLMVEGESVRVVEFNIRFGDPETQALMTMVDDDLLDLLYKSATGDLGSINKIHHKPGAAIVVVLAADGYPGSYRREIPLKNLDTSSGDIIPFHAGTRHTPDGLVSNGGRVLGLGLQGSSLTAVRTQMYTEIEHFCVDGLFYRTDIGAKGV
ncbi:MAG: phosphoribosylamine--glycine ligase [Leptospiraceae bacterium]|nr:phosphoribosylamine--glycine ligase [Leptospiraceae bacterium]